LLTRDGTSPADVRKEADEAVRSLGWKGLYHVDADHINLSNVDGYIEHYRNMLPADTGDAIPRFHHISLRRDDEPAMRREIAELGLPLAFEGPMSIKEAIPSLVFVYLDARQTLGHYVEFTWKSPEAWQYVGWPEGRPVW
ncbi:MAG: hypothetical protein ACK2U9_13950, partial [Anaerolineae bacterium]